MLIMLKYFLEYERYDKYRDRYFLTLMRTLYGKNFFVISHSNYRVNHRISRSYQITILHGKWTVDWKPIQTCQILLIDVARNRIENYTLIHEILQA